MLHFSKIVRYFQIKKPAFLFCLTISPTFLLTWLKMDTFEEAETLERGAMDMLCMGKYSLFYKYIILFVIQCHLSWNFLFSINTIYLKIELMKEPAKFGCGCKGLLLHFSNIALTLQL